MRGGYLDLFEQLDHYYQLIPDRIRLEPRGRSRHGFTLLEIVIVLVVLALLAGALVPAILGRLSQGQAGSLATTLDALREGVLEYRADVRRFPTHLRYLSSPPGTAVDICDRTVPPSFLAEWKGPYLNRSIGSSGLQVGTATVLDSIVRSPATFTASTVGELIIQVADVDSSVARSVEREQDVTPDFAAGTIRWTHVLAGRGTLQLVIPARGC